MTRQTRNIPQSQGNPASRRILVVDDDSLLRWSVAETLKSGGFDVVEAAEAAMALEILHAGPIDVVLLDCQLPDDHGCTVLRAVRESFPATRVVMMSAFALPSEAVRDDRPRFDDCRANRRVTRPR